MREPADVGAFLPQRVRGQGLGALRVGKEIVDLLGIDHVLDVGAAVELVERAEAERARAVPRAPGGHPRRAASRAGAAGASSFSVCAASVAVVAASASYCGVITSWERVSATSARVAVESVSLPHAVTRRGQQHHERTGARGHSDSR